MRKVFYVHCDYMNSYSLNTYQTFQQLYQYANITLYRQSEVRRQIRSIYHSSTICFKIVVCYYKLHSIFIRVF